MRLWKLDFDEERYADESPHDFSWGSANHATPEDVVAWLVEHGAFLYTTDAFPNQQIAVSDPGRYLIFPMGEEVT